VTKTFLGKQQESIVLLQLHVERLSMTAEDVMKQSGQRERMDVLEKHVERLSMKAEDVDIMKDSEFVHQAELPAEKLEQMRMHREEIWTRLVMYRFAWKKQRRLLNLHNGVV